MNNITEKQLIESLKSMKDIKPRKDWAFSLKSQILAEKKVNVISQPSRFAGFFNAFAPRKLAYSLATLLILAAGVFGMMKLLQTGTVSQKSTASITTQTVAKADPKVVAAINSKIRDLTQALKINPTQNPQIIQGIAISLKTLADIHGENLTANPDVQDLYKTVVANQILDLQKTTLTDDQQKILADTVNLYNAGKYSEALEKILSINQ